MLAMFWLLTKKLSRVHLPLQGPHQPVFYNQEVDLYTSSNLELANDDDYSKNVLDSTDTCSVHLEL